MVRSDMYDHPGSWLIDNPRHKVAVAAVVAGLVFVPTVMAANSNPGGVKHYPGGVKTYPGGIKNYKAPHSDRTFDAV